MDPRVEQVRTSRLALSLLALTVGASGLVAGAPPASAEDRTFATSTPINVPGFGDVGSTLGVTGVSGPVSGVRVTLHGVNISGLVHASGVLVSPSGRALLLFEKIGSTTASPMPALTFSDSAATFAGSGPLTGDTYKPSNNDATTASFPAPGPGTAYQKPGPLPGNTATLTSTFGGDAANGTWALYVHNAGSSGTIAGWSLTLSTPSATPPPAAPHGPETALTGKPRSVIKSAKRRTKVSFSFSSPTPGAAFECSLDGAAFAACTTGKAYTLRPGRYSFAVRAVAAGVPDPTPEAYQFKVKRKKKHRS